MDEFFVPKEAKNRNCDLFVINFWSELEIYLQKVAPRIFRRFDSLLFSSSGWRYKKFGLNPESYTHHGSTS